MKREETNTGGWPYEAIVNLPHHVSARHPPMPIAKRAAQFAPFAALTGYDDAVAETARLTDEQVDLTEEAVSELGRQINEAKAGGVYLETTGKIKKIESGEIVLEDGRRIPAGNVTDVLEV